MKTSTSFIDRILQNRVLSHILFWLFLLVGNAYWKSIYDGDFVRNIIHDTAILPTQLMAAYILIYYQIPKLFKPKKYIAFFVSFILSIFVFSAMARIALVYGAEPFTRTDFEQESIREIISDIEYLFIIYFPAVYIPSLILWLAKAVKDRYEIQHQLEVLQKEKAKTELKFLKAQIHPHFLFNTLNNLYALTLDKSDKAPEVVIKLSEMLDYILYQCSDPTIAIHKEVGLIQNYIDLELLRYGQQINLQFKQEIDNADTPIAPLILLSIVENAFKHGASKNPIDPVIHIDLKVKGSQLSFKVFNTKVQLSNENEGAIATVVKSKKGVGSVNIKRQLDLIYWEQYELNINETDADYVVDLKINLK